MQLRRVASQRLVTNGRHRPAANPHDTAPHTVLLLRGAIKVTVVVRVGVRISRRRRL